MIKDLIGWILMGAAYGAMLTGVLVFFIFPTVWFLSSLVYSAYKGVKGDVPDGQM